MQNKLLVKKHVQHCIDLKCICINLKYMTILSATNFPGMIYVWVFIRDKLTLMSMIEVHSWVLPNSYTSHDFADTNKYTVTVPTKTVSSYVLAVLWFSDIPNHSDAFFCENFSLSDQHYKMLEMDLITKGHKANAKELLSSNIICNYVKTKQLS